VTRALFVYYFGRALGVQKPKRKTMPTLEISRRLRPRTVSGRSRKRPLSTQQQYWLFCFFNNLRAGAYSDGSVTAANVQRHELLYEKFGFIFYELPPKTKAKLHTYLQLERADASGTLTAEQFLDSMYTEMMKLMTVYTYPQYNHLRLIDTSKK